MTEVCPICGLPKDLCVCKVIAREQAKIKIRTEKKRFGKTMTVIEGIDEKSTNVKELLKFLKTKLACGGTYKNNVIELQGDHKKRVKELLLQQGFPSDLIEVL